MSSKEGKTHQNPIRANRVKAASDYYAADKAVKAFGNQIPGSYAKDVENTYICTTYKTVSGERVWERIDPITLRGDKQYFILVKVGQKNFLSYSLDSSGKKIYYNSIAIRGRNTGFTKLNLPFMYGKYIFIGLSNQDIDKIKGEPLNTSPGVGGGTYSDDLFTATMSEAQLSGVAEMYRKMRENSNGRSGFGQTKSTVYANSSQTPSTPSPSGKTNPSSRNSGKPSTRKKPGTSPQASNSPGSTTVRVSFSPEKIFNTGAEFNNDKPYIEQEIIHFSKQRDAEGKLKDVREKITRRHVFDIVPNTFQISQLSSTWNEVERSGNYPMVDWAKYNLTKCSFSFLVSGNRVEVAKIGSGEASVTTVLNDGLDVSVDEQIENIRIIAGTPSPVRLYNLNTLLSTSFRYPYLENTRGIQWVIADMSVNVTRMTPNGRSIAVAEVSITLNEYPLISREIVPLPALTPFDPKKTQCKKQKCPPPSKTSYGLWYEETWTWLASDTTSFPASTTGV